jgi:hypothetical protein
MDAFGEYRVLILKIQQFLWKEMHKMEGLVIKENKKNTRLKMLYL